MAPRLLAAGALLALAIAAPAQAKTTGARYVTAHAGAITCAGLTAAKGPGITCASQIANGATNPILTMKSKGTAKIGSPGSLTGFPAAKAVKLNTGDHWKWAGITCGVTSGALTCRNAVGKSFRITALQFTVFN